MKKFSHFISESTDGSKPLSDHNHGLTLHHVEEDGNKYTVLKHHDPVTKRQSVVKKIAAGSSFDHKVVDTTGGPYKNKKATRVEHKGKLIGTFLHRD